MIYSAARPQGDGLPRGVPRKHKTAHLHPRARQKRPGIRVSRIELHRTIELLRRADVRALCDVEPAERGESRRRIWMGADELRQLAECAGYVAARKLGRRPFVPDTGVVGVESGGLLEN